MVLFHLVFRRRNVPDCSKATACDKAFMKNRLINIWQSPYLLVALLGIGTILRVVSLNRDSLWFDEAISYLNATLPVDKIVSNVVQSSHPPLYYLLLHFWMTLFPDSDGSLRLLGVFWGLLIIPAIYLLTLELLGSRRLAAWAALLITISPFQVLYGHELRMYTQLMLLVTMGTYAFLRAVKSERLTWWSIFLVLFGCAIYTHLFAWFIFIALGLFCFIRYRWTKPTIVMFICGLILLLLFIPWLLQLLNERQRDLGTLRPLTQDSTRNPLKPLTSLAFLLIGTSTRPWSTGLALFLTISVIIVLLLEARKASREDEASNLLLPGLVVISVIVIPTTIYLVRPYFLPERTMAGAAPFLLILLAWGTTRRGSPLHYLIYATAIMMIAGTLLYLVGEPVKPPYRAVMALVAENRQENDLVLHTSDGSYVPALRYVDFDNHTLLAGDPDPRKPMNVYEILGGRVIDGDLKSVEADRMWLIVAFEHSLKWQEEQAATFARRYPLMDEEHIGGIGIFLYDLTQLVGEKS